MKKFGGFVGVVLLLSTILYFILVKPDTKTIYIKNIPIKVLVANTAQTQKKGLMYKKSLPKEMGMLFVFENEGPHSFWMKNTLIPLTMIWIDKDNKIVHIEDNAKPCYKDPCQIYYSPKASKYVLEVNASFATTNDILVGDEVKISE